MTTRLKGLVVTLERDMREDDAESVINAIKMIRHVGSVDVVESNIDDHINRTQVRGRLERKLWDALKPDYIKKIEKEQEEL